MKRLFAIWSGLTGLTLLAAGCGDVGSENATLGESTQKITNNFKLGDAVNFQTFEITLKSVESLNRVGSEFFRENVADGGVYVAAVYTLKNTGDKPIGMFDGPTLKLVDPAGTVYDADVAASSAFSTEKDFNEKVMSDLNPGISVNAGKVWEVSKEKFDPTTWKLVLDGHEDSPIALK